MNCSPFFSIVVPCYNVGKYVGDTIRSVREQSFADWECLLSVEESTDDTLAICEAAAAEDPRIRVLPGGHTGSASTPRNRAIAAAKGVYAVWLDGDDLLADGALSKLAELARANDLPDLIESEMEERLEDASGAVVRTTRNRNFDALQNGRVLTGEEAMVASAQFTADLWPSPGMATMRLDFVRANGLTFVDGWRFEDTEWFPRALYAARRVLVTDFCAQVYRHRPHSETTVACTASALVFMARVFGSLFRFYATHEFSPALSRAWARSQVSHLLERFFLTAPRAGIRGRDWTEPMGVLWREAGGRRGFLRLMRFAGLPKRVAAPLVALCGIHPLLDLPAKLYFKFLYYPLVMRQVRRRAEEARQ
jgi:glycosyltransferase involved in cell wall biosynthesis